MTTEFRTTINPLANLEAIASEDVEQWLALESTQVEINNYLANLNNTVEYLKRFNPKAYYQIAISKIEECFSDYARVSVLLRRSYVAGLGYSHPSFELYMLAAPQVELMQNLYNRFALLGKMAKTYFDTHKLTNFKFHHTKEWSKMFSRVVKAKTTTALKNATFQVTTSIANLAATDRSGMLEINNAYIYATELTTDSFEVELFEHRFKGAVDSHTPQTEDLDEISHYGSIRAAGVQFVRQHLTYLMPVFKGAMINKVSKVKEVLERIDRYFKRHFNSPDQLKILFDARIVNYYMST